MHAVADYFPNVAEACGEAVGVDKARRFSGLSGYRRLMESGVEAVALVVPPYFFPEQTRVVVEAGLHVYMAKPVAVDVPGSSESSRRAGRRRSGSGVFWWTTKCRPTRGTSRCASASVARVLAGLPKWRRLGSAVVLPIRRGRRPSRAACAVDLGQ